SKSLTQGYAPAEQILGKPVPQSDFFALGRTFIYLLTGKEPQEIPENLDTCELLWREFATGISEDFADLIDWAIAPISTERPRDTKAILQRLMEIKFNVKSNGIKRKEIPQKVKGKKWGLVGVGGGAIALAFSLFSALPNLAILANDLGVDNHLSKRLNIAQLFYRIAILLDPKYHSPRYNLGVVYETQEQFDLAIQQYRNVIELEPEFAVGYKNLGRLYAMKKRRYDEAEIILQAGLSLPHSEETGYGIYKNLGLTYFYQKRYREAQSYLEEAARIKPERAAPYCLLGLLLEKVEKNGELYWQKCQVFAENDTSKEVEHLLFGLELD
ncbi:MAG: tetratricopeptide repeat protein, partial [Okeania sp. SIO2H7]|nr:tetratricopeptide repeat protein [Okeania sp. SIO2H7]